MSDIKVEPQTFERLQGKLIVTPDSTTPGSEGRLYLQFPTEFEPMVGRSFRTLGTFRADRGILLVRDSGGCALTPRRQMWWKNGVRDHGLRENWWVWVYPLDHDFLAVLLKEMTGEPMVALPPKQDTLFP